jgi:hypothetical protein
MAYENDLYDYRSVDGLSSDIEDYENGYCCVCCQSALMAMVPGIGRRFGLFKGD